MPEPNNSVLVPAGDHEAAPGGDCRLGGDTRLGPGVTVHTIGVVPRDLLTGMHNRWIRPAGQLAVTGRPSLNEVHR